MSCGMYQCLMKDELATVTLHLSYGMCQCMIKDEPAKYCNITSCHMACISVQLRMSLQHWHNILSHGSCTQAHPAVTVEGRGLGWGWGVGGRIELSFHYVGFSSASPYVLCSLMLIKQMCHLVPSLCTFAHNLVWCFRSLSLLRTCTLSVSLCLSLSLTLCGSYEKNNHINSYN